MALTPIWWACDLMRYFKNRNAAVVTVKDDWVKKAFTAVDPLRIMSAWRAWCEKQ
jgi:hypothetical protein